MVETRSEDKWEGKLYNPCYRGYGLDQNGDSESDEKRTDSGCVY